MANKRLRPVVSSDWRLIGPSPDLKGIIPGAEEWEDRWTESGREGEHNAPVDHHLFRDPRGTWHLWGCVRATAVGRILYHWRTDDFFAAPWEMTGEIIRVDRDRGESYSRSVGEGSVGKDEECIQSPFFLNIDGTFSMFYGGGGARPTEGEIAAAGTDGDGEPPDGCQMCLMTSRDGVEWTRCRNRDGNSRLFIGPGPTRDPCLINVGDLWHMYYAGSRPGELDRPVFWCRTSSDLYTWSDPVCVHEDLNYGPGRWDTECPYVVFRDGYYYLFRTEDYYLARTHVLRSEDPLDFGVGDASDKYVGIFPAGAPELYEIDGRCYVSSNHNPPLGTQIAQMEWVKE